MNLKEVDLHIHTNCSDGEFSVDDTLKLAKEKGIKYIGIVDHDTIKQFEELSKSQVAKDMLEHGYRIFAGIEFSAKIDEKKLHLIGYGINYHRQEIKDIIKKNQELRKQKLEDRIEDLKKANVNFTDKQLSYLRSIKNVGKPHIAKCMVENGVDESVEIVIKKYLNNGDKLYRVEAKDIIDAVHATGGFVVIAHPYQIATENKISNEYAERIWKKLVDLGVNGMECYYSKYTIDEIKSLLNFATQNNLLITMGSDFHGESVKPGLQIGQIFKKQ